MGVEPILINSALVSAQNRQRYYWCNWGVEQPEDRGVLPIDIMQEKGYAAATNRSSQGVRHVQLKRKFNCITASYYKGVRSTGRPGVLIDEKLSGIDFDIVGKNFRMLTPTEAERLQTLPDNYTEGISNTQRYRALGNGWTVSVIEHLFKELKCQI